MTKDFSATGRVMRLPLVLLCMAILAACGREASGPSADPRNSGRVFSAAERKAALALSMGRPKLLRAEGTAYDRAILCKVALDSLVPRLRTGISLEQGAQLSKLQDLFEERVKIQGGAAGKSAQDIAHDLAAKAADNDDLATYGPVAMACLRTAN